MRASIAISVIILVMAAGLGWHFDQRLATARAIQETLVAEATRSGLSINPSDPTDGSRVTKRPREAGENPVQLAADYLAVAKELRATRESGVLADEALVKASTDLWKRMRLLDFSLTKILVAELHASDLSDKEGAIYSLLKDLVIDQPQAVLTLLTETADLVHGQLHQQLLATALVGWARQAPLAAFDWIQQHGGSFPEDTTRKLKIGVIYSAAVTDPKLAFDFLGKTGVENPGIYVGIILESAGTAEARTAALAAYREYFANLTDDKARGVAKRAVSRLTEGIAKDGFAAASRWLDSANLSPDELNDFAGRLPSYSRAEDRAQWIDWMEKSLPPDKAANGIWGMVTEWTKADYQAAGKWLADTPDGSVKEAAIRAYAASVASADPETAVQWALTLPPGKSRELTLRGIHRNWPKGDTAGAAAFAEEHGIK